MVMIIKYKTLILIGVLTILGFTLIGQTYCLKYTLIKSSNTAEFTVSLRASGSSFRLGASNLQFLFNSAALANPTLVSHTLNEAGVYNGITLTQPKLPSLAHTSDAMVSFNFDFTGTTGTGIPISIIGTDIAVLRFQIVDGSQSPNLRPYENGSAGTIVYNDNASNPVLLTSTGNCAIYNTLIPTLSVKAYSTGASDKQTVTIDWTTTYEKDNNYFMIERSINGRPFTAIGGYIFATKANRYSFVDINPLKALNRYRIRQIDVGGPESVSNVVDVLLEKGSKINVYPSLLTNYNDFITLDVPENTDVKQQNFHILNALGTEVMTGKTAQRIDINVSHLVSGTYLVKVGEEQVKFVKQ